MSKNPLILDLGERSINTVAKYCNCCWRYAKKCYLIVKNNLQIVNNRHKCGRKKKTDEYPELEADIRKIMNENTYTDPHFTTERQFTKLTPEEVMNRLLDTNKYEEKYPKVNLLLY